MPEFDHDKTNYPLRGMHEKVPCIDCHVKPVFTNVGKNCADCHADIHRRQMGSNCEQCHTVKGWDIAPQQVKDHQNRFPLFGAHAAVPCEECHKGAAVGIFYGLSTACESCHLKDWQQTTNPPHAQAGPTFAASNCQGCHNFDNWLGAKFDHSTTGFPLTNGHANVPCVSCHVNNNYNLQIGPTQCGNAGCHLTTWQQTNNPPHPQAGPTFAAALCYNCHQSTVSWNIVTFDHSTTGFLLTNGHANVPCATCHLNNNYNLQIAPNDCGNAGCHLTTWQQTNNPVHSTSGPAFGVANCANCHTTVGWDAASFDHSVTGFTLVGTHMSPNPTPCASCHVSNNYTLSSTDCMGCHQSAWQSTQSIGGNVPNHVAAGFPTTASACASCHPITTWSAGQFDHSTTGFPLTQGHANVQCSLCHINGNYNLTIQPTDCGNSQCHLTTWQQTNNPVHSTSGAGFAASNCAKCHTTAGWDAASFDHSVTGFTLTGTHMSPSPTPCASCHANNNYTLNSTDCMGCHQPAWQSTQTIGGNVPNHVAANFPTTAAACASCHPITTWSAGQFDHSTTGFPLTNSHQMSPAGKVAACTQCHIGGNYNLSIATTDCGNSGCHLMTWQQTNNPTHSTSGSAFAASACSTCHDTISWNNSTFNHNVTGFTLTGMHVSPNPAPCVSCHVGNNYNLQIAPTDCGNSACHLTQWNSTATMGPTIPNHLTAGFPMSQCSTCHDTTSWANSTFNHSSTGFPLTNAHASVQCGQCHQNNNYSTLSIQPTDCGNAGCHLTTWQQTTNPTHSTLGAAFAASQCSGCHDTIAWTDLTSFNHAVTGWPLTGAHLTGTCVSCHVNNSYNLTSTDCYGCHQANFTSTTSPNHVAAGFPTSQCSTCHDTTAWTDSTFNHNNTGFALTGLHTSLQCAQCHGSGSSGNYSLGTPQSCADTTGGLSCHMNDWSTTSNPTHSLAGSTFGYTNCAYCHSTASAFTTTSWSHTSTGWTLTGTHQTTGAANCNSCHNSAVSGANNYSLSVTDCYNSNCHLTDWNSTQTIGGTVPNHVTMQYPTSYCSSCHDTISFADAVFNHANTGWPLTGYHLTMACTGCHTGTSPYSLTATNTACYGCHMADWNSTQPGSATVPNHITAGYPTTCDTCHTTTAWTGATFNHTWFTIPHNGSVCGDCHQVSTDYTQFTCINCHTNTSAHRPGMSHPNVCSPSPSCWYGATLCYNCHHG